MSLFAIQNTRARTFTRKNHINSFCSGVSLPQVQQRLTDCSQAHPYAWATLRRKKNTVLHIKLCLQVSRSIYEENYSDEYKMETNLGVFGFTRPPTQSTPHLCSRTTPWGCISRQCNTPASETVGNVGARLKQGRQTCWINKWCLWCCSISSDTMKK